MLHNEADVNPGNVACELEGFHTECEAAMAVMHSLIASTIYDTVQVPAARHRMSQASTKRLKFLSQIAYPCVLQFASQDQIAAIRALQAQATTNRARSSAHVTKWSSAAVGANWNAFRRDSAGILAMMADRLEQERKVLVPMLKTNRV